MSERTPATPTSSTRLFRFLASVGEIVDGRALTADARRAESMGYCALVIPCGIDELAPVVERLAGT